MAAAERQEAGSGPSVVLEDSDGSLGAWDGGAPASGQARQALDHLHGAVTKGTAWPIALLEAIGLWTAPEELFRGRLHRYLLQGEAFDWLLLAQRLTREAVGAIPAPDRARLLRQGLLPAEIPDAEFRRLIGVPKFRAHLNFWYGVTVEASLQEALRDEVRKERFSRGLSSRSRVTTEAFRRIYGEPRSQLMQRFLQVWLKPPVALVPRGFLKEFTYWLFKRRIHQIEKARVASDTRKGLEWLSRNHRDVFLWQAAPPGLDTDALRRTDEA